MTTAIEADFNQTVLFTKYVRVVLPLDGYVFWLRADQVKPAVSAQLAAKGIFHYATDKEQREDATIGVNKVIFTTKERVQEFNQITPSTMFVAVIPNSGFDVGSTSQGIRFAFSRRDPFTEHAGIYHYYGEAVYPYMQPQLIDTANALPTTLIVSNSLPIWLAMNQVSPLSFIEPSPQTAIPLFPSFAVPDNEPTPYISVHIEPEDTEAIQPIPYLSFDLSHYQLARDIVRFTLYGLTNDQALLFQDAINSYCINTELFGLMNEPIVRDQKEKQTELSILSMKKTLIYEISYYQNSARHIARQLITNVLEPTLYPSPL